MGVVIADSDSMSLRLLRFVLESAGYEDVLISLTGLEVLDLVKSGDIDLVLLEVDLADTSGFDLCRELRSRRYTGPIVFVSNRTSPLDRVHAFELGADDFISKPVYPQELTARVAAVARRYGQQDYQALGTILKVGDAELSITDLTFRAEGRPPVRLTPTEIRILECLMRNANITISRETLIERTWGFDFFGDSNRVDVYIRRLRSKIEVDQSHPEYLHTVRRVGYVFRSRTRIKRESEPVARPVISKLNGAVDFDYDTSCEAHLP
jgi:DNA-binding response OmpR family regulator